jgi:hypothetical protein
MVRVKKCPQNKPSRSLSSSRQIGLKSHFQCLQMSQTSIQFKESSSPNLTGLLKQNESLRKRSDTLEKPCIEVTNTMSIRIPLRNKVQYKRMEALLRRRLCILQKEEYASKTQIAHICYKLALCLVFQGRDHEAEQYQCQSVFYRLREFGENDPHTIFSMSNLAAILHRLGKFKAARNVALLTLKSSNSFYGPDHWRVLVAHHNLAVVCAALGELGDAHAHITLAVHGGLLGKHSERIELATTICSAWIESLCGRYDKAAQLYRQASSILEESPNTATALRATCQKLASEADSYVKSGNESTC